MLSLRIEHSCPSPEVRADEHPRGFFGNSAQPRVDREYHGTSKIMGLYVHPPHARDFLRHMESRDPAVRERGLQIMKEKLRAEQAEHNSKIPASVAAPTVCKPIEAESADSERPPATSMQASENDRNELQGRSAEGSQSARGGVQGLWGGDIPLDQGLLSPKVVETEQPARQDAGYVEVELVPAPSVAPLLDDGSGQVASGMAALQGEEEAPHKADEPAVNSGMRNAEIPWQTEAEIIGLGKELEPVPPNRKRVRSKLSPLAEFQGLRPRREKGEPGLTAPEWCGSIYRTQHLTSAAIEVLRSLDPSVRGFACPLELVNPTESAASHLRFLSARHAGLRLVRHGAAVSVGCAYLHPSRIRDASRVIEEFRETAPRGLGEVSKDYLLTSIAMCRRATLEQILMLAPSSMGDTLDLLEHLLAEKVIESSVAEIGKGVIATYALTNDTWKEFRKRNPDAKKSGWGPRSPRPQNREYHEQVAGDAAMYYLHDLMERGCKPLNLRLDGGLRKEFYGHGCVPDLRIDYLDPSGSSQILYIEIEGIGKDYRSLRHYRRMNSPWNFQQFSTQGRVYGEFGVAV